MIVTRLRGGLGNQMFQYAAGAAAAAKRGERLALDLSWFDGPGAVNPRRTYDLGIFAMQPAHASRLQTLVAKLRSRYMNGFFQEEGYFKDIASQIRNDFAFKDPVLPGSQALAQKISSPNSICINVRRTDFVTGGIFVGTDYYIQAVGEMKKRFPDATFFVFSDDIEWCRANLSSIARTTFVGPEHAGAKYANYLQLMALCHHFIIPNSTFGWWAAWLGNRPGKTVIASSNWPQGPEKVIPPEWLRM